MSTLETPETQPVAAEAPASSGGARDRWLAMLAGGVALGLLGLACRALILFQPKTALSVSLSGEVEQWFFEPSDTSPVLVLVLAGWLLARRWRRLTALAGRPGPRLLSAALWVLAAAGFGWAIRTEAADLQALALMPLLLGAANLFGGPPAMRVVALPVAVLAFALPLPAPLLNDVVWRLQIWTADYTGFLLHALGMSALISGDRIIMSDGLFAIIETCSGLRSIETLSLLAVLMIDLFRRRGLHALLVLFAAPPVAFVINGFRALGLIFNPHAEISSIHNLQGILMLLGGVLVLYFWDGFLERLLPRRPRISQAERDARARVGAPRPFAPRFAALAGVAAVWAGISWLSPFSFERLIAPPPQATLEYEIGDWQSSEIKTDWLFLGKAAVQRSTHRRYVSGREQVDVFLAQPDPSVRLRSFLSPKIAYPGSGWLVEEEREGELRGRRVTFRVVRKGTHRLLAAHWYEGEPSLAAESLRALFALDRSVFQRARLPLAVRISTPLPTAADGASAGAEERLERVAELLEPALQKLTTPQGMS